MARLTSADSDSGGQGQSLFAPSAGCLQKGEPEDKPENQMPDTNVIVTVARFSGNVISSPRGSRATVAISSCPGGEDREGDRGRHRVDVLPPIDAQRQRDNN